jgi:CBS domain containing-hemolysin-like protein
MIEALLVVVALLLVAACGVFVAGEFALVTVDRQSVERAARSGDRRARGVLAALRTLSTQLSGAQVGITVTNLVIGYLAEPALARLVAGPLHALGASDGLTRALSVAIGLVLAALVTMIFGELVPKNVAISRPLATARAVQGILRAFTTATRPLISLLNGTANMILRRLGVEPQEELVSARPAEELFSLVGRSAERGTLPAATAAFVQRSLLFGDRTALDVMTPRVRMRTVDVDDPVVEVIRRTRETGHSRFPVVGEGSDDVVGIVHVKHAVGVPEDLRDAVAVREVMAPPVVVPSSLPLDPLLETLRAGGLQIAIVVDEFGGTDGLVTVEDLIEEIVGEVVDEHDRVSPRAMRSRDGSWLLSGLLRPSEARETTGVDIPDTGEYQTLGGLMSHVLGRIPDAGDAVELDGVRYVVERMDGRRVDRVRLRPGAPPPAAAGDGGSAGDGEAPTEAGGAAGAGTDAGRAGDATGRPGAAGEGGGDAPRRPAGRQGRQAAQARSAGAGEVRR